MKDKITLGDGKPVRKLKPTKPEASAPEPAPSRGGTKPGKLEKGAPIRPAEKTQSLEEFLASGKADALIDEIEDQSTALAPAPEKRKPIAGPRRIDVHTPSGALSSSKVVTLKGVSFSGYPEDQLYDEKRVYLRADPCGKVTGASHDDKTAISVQDQKSGGRHIGYLPKEIAKVVFKALTSNLFTYEAEICAYRPSSPGYNWGCDVLIRFYKVEQ